MTTCSRFQAVLWADWILEAAPVILSNWFLAPNRPPKRAQNVWGQIGPKIGRRGAKMNLRRTSKASKYQNNNIYKKFDFRKQKHCFSSVRGSQDDHRRPRKAPKKRRFGTQNDPQNRPKIGPKMEPKLELHLRNRNRAQKKWAWL